MKLSRLNEVQIGEVGEHICVTRLLKMDIPAHIVHMGCVDVVAEFHDKLWRIQVKTSQLKRNGKTNTGYQFATSKGGKKAPLSLSDCDIVAFVAYDMEAVWFEPVCALRRSITKRLRPATFDKFQSCRRSWERCIDYYE